MAYLTHLKKVDSFKALWAAFYIGLKYYRKIHSNKLPPPKNQKELIRYQYREEFLTTAIKEYTDLDGYGIFKVVNKTLLVKIVPTTQRFTYKINTNRYLTKFKVQLYIKGDL